MLNLSSLGIAPVTLLVFASMFILLGSRVPLAFLTGIISVVLVIGWFSWETLPLIANRVYGFSVQYSLLAVPMFVIMAVLLDKTGIAKDLYNAMWLFTRRLKGGVAIQTIIIGVLLASISGIVGGETILLGMLALPQMLRLKYNKNLAIGICVASGALGTMVPPSIVLIIYGLVASVSISKLFLAAFLPSFMLASFYMLYVIGYGIFRPEEVPGLSKAEIQANPVTRKQRLIAARDIFLPGLLMVGLLGSIYAGIASVTETASVGVLMVMALAIYRREFNLKLLREAAQSTLQTCGTILWIGIGAYILVGSYNLAGGDKFIKELILGSGLSPITVILFMMLIWIFLGMFMDWIGIAMLTIPIFLPIIVAFDYDPIWFGILFCVNMQISFLSPPFGPGAFYLHSVGIPGITLFDIFRSVVPFIFLQVVVLGLIIFSPQIVLFLPSLFAG